MARLKILKYPNPLLRKKSEKIKDPTDPKIQKLINKMIETLRSENGLGLAAPQVGQCIRLCIVECDGELNILINPVVKNKSRKKVVMEEGCLSFPGKFYSVSRPEEIKVRHLDKKGNKAKIKARGILSRAIQHEIDHLDGILVIDRIKNKK